MDARERVRQLQREIKELCLANEEYLKKPTHAPREVQAHMGREQRLKQILDELMRLGGR
jgi:N-glycosylase/DNA lyase